MELKSDFEVGVGVDRAWEVLTNPELIAPCLPGARLDEVEGDEFRGAVKVKVGPISAEYRGKATMVELNRDDLRIVIRAEGRDTRGAGNAAADITALMEAASENSTKVEVTIDLKISGKVAQFGRGVLGDVSAKLMGKFVDNLEEMLSESAEDDQGDEAGDDSDSAGEAEAAAPAVEPAEPEAVDLLEAVPSRLRILAPIIAPILALGLLAKRLVDGIVKVLSFGRRGAA
ncbi:MAG: SRPBCC family protein [Acidimicrobiia bacterium]|nr:SRPBCC family protein [Acidimicrobiia bacterium]